MSDEGPSGLSGLKGALGAVAAVVVFALYEAAVLGSVMVLSFGETGDYSQPASVWWQDLSFRLVSSGGVGVAAWVASVASTGRTDGRYSRWGRLLRIWGAASLGAFAGFMGATFLASDSDARIALSIYAGIAAGLLLGTFMTRARRAVPVD